MTPSRVPRESQPAFAGRAARGSASVGTTGVQQTRPGTAALTKDEAHDLALRAKGFRWPFVMLPEYWAAYSATTRLQWRSVKFTKASRPTLPDAPGVYAFLATPRVGRLHVAFLMYVGQTDSLRRRYRDYQREASPKTKSRPKLYHMFRSYPEHLQFSYALVPLADCVPSEEALMTAFWPPVNHNLPAQIRAARRAFES